MPWPLHWETLRSKAEDLLKQGDVEEVEFSSGTYQVKVLDPLAQEEVWAFLQLDEQGQIKDCFCSCQEGSEEHPCLHLAAALLRIYSGTQDPLHIRFQSSLWNELCRLALKKCGETPSRLTFKAPRTWFRDKFVLRGRNQAGIVYLSGLTAEKEPETEETSIKFSNLTEEELENWREGQPSNALRYELSFWSDLAKHLMLIQDEGVKYTLRFLYDGKTVPIGIAILTDELFLSFPVTKNEWGKVIPTLAAVKSPLLVHGNLKEIIGKITYDPSSKEMTLHPNKEYPAKVQESKNAHDLGDFVFVPGKGFYPKKKESLLQISPLKGQDIGAFLEKYAKEAKPLFTGVSIHYKPVRINFQPSFDEHWNLHIEPYLNHVGDMSDLKFEEFGPWIYVAGYGFTKYGRIPFSELKPVIPQDKLVDFIRDYRGWLDGYEGFQTHLSSIETQLKYHVDEMGRLSFSRGIPLHEEALKSHDFGLWLYVDGQGFYPRASMPIAMPIPPGISLAPEQIPGFIHQQREDLKLIPGFFLQDCPLNKAGLEIALSGQEKIEITPKYELISQYASHKFHIYDDIIYVEGAGFYELPYEFRLPQRYLNGVELSGEAMLEFLQEELPLVTPMAWSIDPRIVPAQTLHLEVEKLVVAETAGQRRYGMQLRYRTEKGIVPVYDVWKALNGRKKCLFSEAGSLPIMDARFGWLSKLPAEQIDAKKQLLYLNTLDWIRLQAFEKVELSTKVDVTTRGVWYGLTHMKLPTPPNLEGLKSTLRPYQQTGVEWLWFLFNHGLSGLLCDDMGLGKTHQGMALFAAVTNQAKEKQSQRPKFLVLCPTSVLYHWQEKLQAFLPNCKVLLLHGEFRHTDVATADFDVLLTSYGIWRNSYATLSEIAFTIAVFDEIQIAKSHISRTHMALLHVKATLRLGMTGTPIENHLRELKSLFDLVLPTYMPSESDYQRIFVKPIQKEHNTQRSGLLSRFIKPFVLRRRKEEVLTDLPEKTEEISHCDMHPTQRKLYQETWQEARKQIMGDLEDNKKPIPFIHIFSIISRFKQICDHPALYLKKYSDYKKFHSGKWDLFIELLHEARESEQKVVIYSQFLGMLDIIEHYLKEHKIGFAGIRGATVDRGEQIARFHRDKRCEVFVASLQAAGLGVDLTAASVVIHYDRWWNAARENQATDRVHRIGQTRGVQVFKLVTKDTFEERIDAIISRKKELMEVVGVDDYQIIKHLTRDEILELLQLWNEPS